MWGEMFVMFKRRRGRAKAKRIPENGAIGASDEKEKHAPAKADSFETTVGPTDEPVGAHPFIKSSRYINRVDSLLGSPPKHQVSRNLHDLIENNRQWASQKLQGDPDYFKRLSSVQQQPNYLWIGCSDSRVPANQIVNMPPGEIFVHRNVANLVGEADNNAMSVIQYAVENLKVKHIIVCGHSCCGGVRACFGPELPNPLEEWLSPVRSLRETYAAELEALPDQDAKWRFLCEANVRQQVAILEQLPIIRKAWENDQPLALHGWLYSMDEGLLRDLDVTRDNGSFPSVESTRNSIDIHDISPVKLSMS